MAKTFKSLQSTQLGLYDFFTFGKYQNCRVDSIIEMDYNYILFLNKSNKNLFTAEVLRKCRSLQEQQDSERFAKEELQPFEDVPF
jgi:hypothetical protein